MSDDWPITLHKTVDDFKDLVASKPADDQGAAAAKQQDSHYGDNDIAVTIAFHDTLLV
jgi:hypothetical protein